MTYTYDGDGDRVMKSINQTTGTLYYGGSGTDALSEANASGTIVADCVFFGGKRIARIDNPGATETVHYYLSDHLGSHSVVASAAGVQELETMFFPYGGERWSTGSDSNHYKFTGKERDTETGNDYFGARYYSSTMSRWMSPDWAANATAVPYADFGDPQTLNLYGYVRNNPITRSDLDGHKCDICKKILDAMSQGVSSAEAAMRGAAKVDSKQPVPATQKPPKANEAAYTKQGKAIVYKQSTGDFTQLDALGNSKKLGIGYAGHGQGLNDPESESVGESDDAANAGPLPRGQYTIGKQQDNQTHGGKVTLFNSMRLTPSPLNEMFGRAGFLIHGDNSSHNQSASEGCPVADPATRNAIGQSGIKTLVVEE